MVVRVTRTGRPRLGYAEPIVLDHRRRSQRVDRLQVVRRQTCLGIPMIGDNPVFNAQPISQKQVGQKQDAFGMRGIKGVD